MPAKYSIHPKNIITSIFQNRILIIALTKREVQARYKGSLLGLLWSLMTPLLMLGVYTFVFSVVFNVRWNGGEATNKIEFALLLFAGLMVFNLFAECISRAPFLVISNVNYIKKVVFPLEILAWVGVGAALFQFLASLAIWLAVYTLFIGIPGPYFLLLPLVVTPLIFLIIGLSWLLAAIGVYIRDISQAITMLITLLMFLAPIFYPASALPKDFQILFALNPLTIPIEVTRDVLFWGRIPDIFSILIYGLSSIVVAYLGFVFFQLTRRGFADVV